jgi:hypothetical protein
MFIFVQPSVGAALAAIGIWDARKYIATEVAPTLSRIKVNASAKGTNKCKIWFKTIENHALMNIM